MACNCKKTKTPPPPTNKVMVTESKTMDNNIIDKLKTMMGK